MPSNPQTADERVHKIHDLASDDVVAARVASDFLRRPEVAHRVVSDSTARHVINRAQIDHGRQAREVAQQRTPVIKQLAFRIQIVDLLGACGAFVAAMNRHVPSLSDLRLGGKERAAVLEQLRRVHAAADWCETVAQTGDISIDDQLEQLLRGDGS